MPLSTTIQATFSKDIDPASIYNKSFIVADAAYIPINGTYSYDPDTRTATFIPSALLTQVTEYNVLITTDVTDTDGYWMTNEVIWYFTSILTGVVPNPFFNPPAPGPYDGTQNIIIDCQEPSATIRYTLDGTVPTCSSGFIYTSPIPVSVNTVNPIQAIACRAGYTDSSVVGASYIIRVMAPLLNPMPGNYSSDQTITITTATPGAVIQYTTNGDDPLTLGTPYVGPFTITGPGPIAITVRAIAIDPLALMANSTPILTTYNISYVQVAAPVFKPDPGTYTSAQTVTISTTTAGAVIRYTTDGSNPSSSYGTIGNSVTVSDTMTLKAIAYDPSLVMTDSSITSGAYTIAPRLTAITPNKGPNTAPVTITIKGKNFKPGATARLTLGASNIFATSLSVIDSDNITCTFDITGASPTKWDVIVTNTDGGTSINLKWFRIY